MDDKDMSDVIAQVAKQAGRSVEEVRAYLADDAAQDWPMLRAFLERGVTPDGKCISNCPPDVVDES